MQHGPLSAGSRSASRLILLPPALVLFALRPMTAVAQSTTASAVATFSMSAQWSRSSAKPALSTATSFVTSLASNATTSSDVSTSTRNTITPLFPESNNPDPTAERNEGVFNYYFLFLAVFGVLVAVFLWWLHRRRRKRKEQMRLSGQNALARDMEGWINTRRWFHGAWRPNQTATFIRREEGLNEDGEAPPPYQPKGTATVTQSASQDPTAELPTPLRTLSREGITMSNIRLPEYRDAMNRAGTSAPGLGTPHSNATQSNTVRAPGSSVRSLLQE